ncbi:hypothetical protein G3T14_12595 [Methylobacterium sp. BTF04]|uniref:hypothetical protein n=1 Tax=Methylobacterium sp. BTF04 TaxID=2708300 RepID=UPI0013CF4EB8|nr:hypothetical protein [Methylobacterium sp. BTF04]NEU12971.1 hypothetical protein [Methylobacterium sp. BTF04]
MHEHIVAAVIRLDEPKTLLLVEPLNSTDSHHIPSPLRAYMSEVHANLRGHLPTNLTRNFEGLNSSPKRGAKNSGFELVASLYAFGGDLANRHLFEQRHHSDLCDRHTFIDEVPLFFLASFLPTGFVAARTTNGKVTNIAPKKFTTSGRYFW